MVSKCNECLKHKPSKQKENLKPRPVPTRPWEKVGSDLFHLGGSNYIVITDYYSLWPEVYQLKQATSACVISTMKDVFARHGIPTELVSDNGSQYKSARFRTFTREWNFQHSTSSPRYPRSNGLAESSVKTVKMMMKKCLATKKDVKQGLLTIRNTPLACGQSPAELLMNRQLNDNLPRLPAKLSTNQLKTRDLVKERRKQKVTHDSKLQQRKSPCFKPGQRIALQDPATKLWTGRGTIIKEVAPRSFDVRIANGGTLRRNQHHLRKLHSTTSTTEQPQEDLFDDPEVLTEDSNSDSEDSDASTLPYNDETEGTWYNELPQGGEMALDIVNSSPPQPQQTLTTTLSGRVVKQRRPLDYGGDNREMGSYKLS